MKRHVAILVTAALAAVIANGCSDDKPTRVQPKLVVSPAALTLGPVQREAILELSNSGGGDLHWSCDRDREWITQIDPTEGRGDGSITIVVDREALAPGKAVGSLSITSNGGDDVVEITVDVAGGFRALPGTIDFGLERNPRPLQISNTGDGSINWAVGTTVDWIELDPQAGSGAGEVTVSLNQDTIAGPGRQSGMITIHSSDPGVQPLDVPVSVDPPSFLALDIERANTRFRVYVDTESVATLRTSDPPLPLELEPGDHELAVEDVTTGCLSAPQTLTVPVGETLEVNLTPNGQMPEWKSCPPTGVKFEAAGLSHPRDVYLNGNRVGQLPAQGDLTLEVEAGSYSYHFVDEDCRLTTRTKSVTVESYRMSSVRVTSSSPALIIPEVTGVDVTEGDHGDRVRVTWNKVEPDARYEVWRYTSSWRRVATLSESRYDDSSVQAMTDYWYRIRPVWLCATGEYTSSERGYVAGAKFSNTRITYDNNARRVVLRTDLDIWGRKDKKTAVATYWDKWRDSGWYPQCKDCGPAMPKCGTNCSPNGVLGHSGKITPRYSKSVYTDIQHSFPYDCFPDHRGREGGIFFVYKTSSVDCYANYFARSSRRWVEWNAAAGTAGEGAPSFGAGTAEWLLDDEYIAASPKDHSGWIGAEGTTSGGTLGWSETPAEEEPPEPPEN